MFSTASQMSVRQNHPATRLRVILLFGRHRLPLIFIYLLPCRFIINCHLSFTDFFNSRPNLYRDTVKYFEPIHFPIITFNVQVSKKNNTHTFLAASGERLKWINSSFTIGQHATIYFLFFLFIIFSKRRYKTEKSKLQTIVYLCDVSFKTITFFSNIYIVILNGYLYKMKQNTPSSSSTRIYYIRQIVPIKIKLKN